MLTRARFRYGLTWWTLAAHHCISAVANSITAYGTWIWNPPRQPLGCGPDGEPHLENGGKGDKSGPLPDEWSGMLAGKVGAKGDAFKVGKLKEYGKSPDDTGNLFFVINDDLNAPAPNGLHDNKGFVTVNITIDLE